MTLRMPFDELGGWSSRQGSWFGRKANRNMIVVRVDSGHTQLEWLESDDRVRQAELFTDVRNLAYRGPRARGGMPGRTSSDQRWSTHAFPAR